MPSTKEIFRRFRIFRAFRDRFPFAGYQLGMTANTGTLLERDASILAGVSTVAELREGLALWKAAEKAVASSQSYQLAGRALTRADAPEVRTNLLLYARAVAIAEAKAAGLPGTGPRFVSARFTGGLAEHG